METIEYRTIDKSSWVQGPWQVEPDKVQWQDEATKLPCLIVRGPSGALCGYVGVLPNHPFHGKDYNDISRDIKVHGGLTFADACGHGDEATGICHVPGPGEPDTVWWFGFDCAHCNDVWPDPILQQFGHHAVYRNLAYVKNEVTNLARQLATI